VFKCVGNLFLFGALITIMERRKSKRIKNNRNNKREERRNWARRFGAQVLV